MATSLDVTVLKTKVADLYGLGGDTDAEATAVKALDEAISEINMEMWEFLSSEETGITIVADQKYVTIPTLFYKDRLAFLVRTSDSKQLDPLNYLDWPTFQKLYGPSPSGVLGKVNSIPQVYSVMNQNRDAKVYLGPTPTSDTATNYTITIQYYERLRSATTADADDDLLVVPPEFEVPLLHKARQFFALLIAGPDSSDIAVFQALYDNAITNLREVDRRHPDETTRFRMYDRFRGYQRSRAGGIYTKID
jgi:hypothetical protein